MLHIALFGAIAVYSPFDISIDGNFSAANRLTTVSNLFREKTVNEKLSKTIKTERSPEYSDSSVSDKKAVKDIKDAGVNSENLKDMVKSEKSFPAADSLIISIENFITDLEPVYPGFAKKNNYQGIVRVSLVINGKGRGENISIIKSSGYSVLDRAAVKAVKKASFKAKDKNTMELLEKLKRALIIDIDFSLTQN